MPAFSVCWDYTDIVDVEQVKMAARIPGNTNFTYESNFDNVKQLTTLETLFNLTATKDGVFEQCSMRYNGEAAWTEYIGQECNAIFDVTRFFTQDYICYKIVPNENISKEYNYENVASTMWASGMNYEVGFNASTFDNGYLVVPILHQLSEVLPAVSIYFAPQIMRKDRHKQSTDGIKNYFLMSYSSIGNHMKPPPYDTNCSDYDDPGLFIKSKQGCFAQCLTNYTLTGLNKFPYSVITREGLDYDYSRCPISYRDIHDERIESKVSEYERLCNEKCSKLNCEEVFTITEVRFSDNRADSVFYRIESPRSPNFDIHHYTKVSLNEFVLYSLSCLATWLGLNVLSFNPVHAYNYLKGVNDRRNKVDTLGMRQNRLEQQIKEGNYSAVIRKFTINLRLAQIENELFAQQIKYLYNLAKRKS
ncbi:hypothetical protein HDE_01665 [Halotydeus destructor]|nr:hypothetical protein HDE_01665 [Halotydeus destructor]